MRIIGKPIKRVVNEDGYSELTILIENYRNQQLIKELEKDKDYRIELNVVKSKRSIEQNNYLWYLCEEIANKMNGGRTGGVTSWDVYLDAIEKFGAKYEYIAVLPEAEELLKEQFRAIKLMNSFEHKGRTFNSYKVFYGSSKFNTQEMNLLIEGLLDDCANLGIPVNDYSTY